MELFQEYDVLLDFMGIHAERCLKIHRNDFFEDFHVGEFGRECFQIYMLFLQQNRDKMGNETVEYGWNKYELQLLRMLLFDSSQDIPYELPEQVIGSFQNDGYQVVGDEDSRHLKKINRQQPAKERLEMLNRIYHSIGTIENVTPKECFLLIRENDARADISYHPNVLQNWIHDQLTEQPQKSILDMLVKGQGIYTDLFTHNLLHRDKQLQKEYIQLEVDGEREVFSRFFLPEKPVTKDEKAFYRYFWDTNEAEEIGMEIDQLHTQRRKSLSGENAKRYPALCINQKPFCVDDGEIYILSPLSREAVSNIQIVLSKGQKINYETFRQYAWGKRGDENQEYNMLIDWTFRKRVYKKYTRKNIEEAYESLLKSIYQIVKS